MLCAGLAIFAIATLSSLQGVDGRAHHPFAEASGKPLLFVFVSHDCPICNTYAPELARIGAAYRLKVQIDLVYADPDLSAAKAKAHAKSYGLTGLHLFLDPKYQFAASVGATVTPEAVLYDERGKKAYSGRIDDLFYGLGKQRAKAIHHDLRSALDAILSHRRPDPAETESVGCIILAGKDR